MTFNPKLMAMGRHRPGEPHTRAELVLAVLIVVVILGCLVVIGYVIWHEATT